MRIETLLFAILVFLISAGVVNAVAYTKSYMVFEGGQVLELNKQQESSIVQIKGGDKKTCKIGSSINAFVSMDYRKFARSYGWYSYVSHSLNVRVNGRIVVFYSGTIDISTYIANPDKPLPPALRAYFSGKYKIPYGSTATMRSVINTVLKERVFTGPQFQAATNNDAWCQSVYGQLNQGPDTDKVVNDLQKAMAHQRACYNSGDFCSCVKKYSGFKYCYLRRYGYYWYSASILQTSYRRSLVL
jgi:hypothetical protein